MQVAQSPMEEINGSAQEGGSCLGDREGLSEEDLIPNYEMDPVT